MKATYSDEIIKYLKWRYGDDGERVAGARLEAEPRD